MNKSKDIGTRAETAVARFLRTAGWPHAERRSLRGQLDAGDITGTIGVCWSVKGGAAAKTASDHQVAEWLAEVEQQAIHADADMFLLVLQRKGIGLANAAQWWAIMPGYEYERLCDSNAERRGCWRYGSRGPIRMHLTQACALLCYAGYGGT